MKKRGHEKKVLSQLRRAYRNGPVFSFPPSLLRRHNAQVRKHFTELLTLLRAGNKAAAYMELHYGNGQGRSLSERPITIPSSQLKPVPEATKSSLPAPRSEIVSTEPEYAELGTLTVKELHALCAQAGVTGYSKLRKAALVAVLAEIPGTRKALAL